MTLDRTTPPRVATFSDIILPKAEVLTLPNGVTLHVVSNGNQPISRLTLLWDGGILEGHIKCTNLIMCECLREGSMHYSGEEIADAIDSAGARLSSRSTEHYSGLEILALNSQLSGLLPMIRDIVLHPLFPEDVVAATARRVSSVRAIQLKKVSYIASELARSAVAGRQNPVSKQDTPEEILSVTSETIREFHKLSIGSGRLHAFLAGEIDEKTLNTVINWLSEMPKASDTSVLNIVPFDPEPPQKIVRNMLTACQAAISMSLPTISRHNPDYVTLRIAVSALGGYFGSRLMSNIRERQGLTYGIGASLLGSLEGAYISISAQCDESYIDRVLDAVSNEIRLLASQPPTADELARVRLHGWTTLASMADSPLAAIDYYITQLLVGTPDGYFYEQLEALRNLSSESIAEMVTRYINPDQFRIAIVAHGSDS